jgi:outer membrane lipoprotein-sorting protein
MKTIFAALAVACALLTSGAAAAEGCDAVAAAQIKGKQVPTHATFTTTIGGKTFTFESTALGDKIYSQHKDGTWTVETRDNSDDKIRRAWADETCTPDGSETIGGEATDIVLNHATSSLIGDTRFWISQTTGLILKVESQVSGSVLTSINDYRDVQVPTDAVPR